MTNHFQGNPTVFPSHSGAPNSYIGANYNNTAGTGTISNWLLTPTVPILNGAQYSFWTRTVNAPQFPDRLQVRASTAGASTDVGTTATSVGVFTMLLLDINPTYTTTDYPNVWTQYHGHGQRCAGGDHWSLRAPLLRRERRTDRCQLRLHRHRRRLRPDGDTTTATAAATAATAAAAAATATATATTAASASAVRRHRRLRRRLRPHRRRAVACRT